MSTSTIDEAANDNGRNPDDQKYLDQFVDLIENHISITTGFAQNNETGLLTHQYIKIKSGELEMVSQPEPLETPLMVAPAPDGATIN